MVKRYSFHNIFGKNASQEIFPLFNMVVNGVSFLQYVSIPRGRSFGGLDIYMLEGRDFGGIWDDGRKVLTLTNIY